MMERNVLVICKVTGDPKIDLQLWYFCIFTGASNYTVREKRKTSRANVMTRNRFKRWSCPFSRQHTLTTRDGPPFNSPHEYISMLLDNCNDTHMCGELRVRAENLNHDQKKNGVREIKEDAKDDNVKIHSWRLKQQTMRDAECYW